MKIANDKNDILEHRGKGRVFVNILQQLSTMVTAAMEELMHVG